LFRATVASTPSATALSLHDALPISRIDLVGDPVEPRHHARREAEVGVAGRVRRAELDALGPLRQAAGARVRGADQPRQQPAQPRSEEHTSELQSRSDIVCSLLLEKK